MRPVFANSAWVGGPERLLLRGGNWRSRRLRVRYGLFMHPTAGPTLMDTGYSAHSITAPGRSAGLRLYSRLLAPRLIEEGQAEPFLRRFGLVPRDIATVIVTHFHADHVSALAAFPNARFVGCGSAWEKLRRTGALRNMKHGVFMELIPRDFGQRLVPVECSPVLKPAALPGGHDIFGDGSVLAVPLPGHADGHFGLLFPRMDRPLLYAVDTQWLAGALFPSARPRLLPWLISDGYADVRRSSDLVEAFRGSGGTVLLCHDDAPSPYDEPEEACS